MSKEEKPAQKLRCTEVFGGWASSEGAYWPPPSAEFVAEQNRKIREQEEDARRQRGQPMRRPGRPLGIV